MKKCPMCAEEIQDEAKKCKHCGELLNGIGNSSGTNALNQEEKIIWQGHPSHCFYFFKYVLGVILIPFFIGIIILLYCIIDRKCKHFKLTSKRVSSRTGILSRSVKEVFINDVRSVNLHQNLLERIFRLGSINIGTAGTSGIEVSFFGIPNAQEVKEEIQKLRNL